jgi:radical SAM superfamily enzyme YgiQ (UPF0313 family)
VTSAESLRILDMRVRTHLLAMPWAQPDTPSIQLACLKAHLDRARQGHGDCVAYSAFFSILHDFKAGKFLEFFEGVEEYREYVYLPLYLRRFGPPEFRRRSTVARLVKALKTPWARPLSVPVLDGLERATRRFLDRQVAPRLLARGLNLVGFSLNYHQVYSSLYAAEHLRHRFADRRFLFVYGGCSASLPTVYRLLSDLGVPGVVVVGEGEKKLELLVRTCEGLAPSEARSALSAVAGLDPGIIRIGDPVDLEMLGPAHHATEVKALADLARPDYDEYFDTLRAACADPETYAAFRAATDVLVEGSRGCFSRCDFCGLNRVWQGFRKHSAEEVLRDTVALTRTYRTSQVVFVDNVCDAWAEPYARMLLERGMRHEMFMELRANHPERFWTLMALSGLENVQVGIEAISPPLMKAIGKGTTVIQNLAAQKYLSELGVWPSNNLITHHPASTMADVRETCRILRDIPHWGRFKPTRFALMAGSPLYDNLSRDQRAALGPVRNFRLPPAAARYALEYSYELPAALSPGRDVMRAWSAFARRYKRELARHEARPPRLDVVRIAPDTLRITDTRHGRMRYHDVSGDAARIYDACHAGLTLDQIARAAGLPPETVTANLAKFLRAHLVLRVGDSYLSLALRSRDELLLRFFSREIEPSRGGPQTIAAHLARTRNAVGWPREARGGLDFLNGQTDVDRT